MDGGRFTILLLLIVVLAGGGTYYSYTQIEDLRAQLAGVSGKIDPVQTNAINAGKLANAAKAAADTATVGANKANAAIDQLTAAVTVLQTKPVPTPVAATKHK
jgi:hypothetical protein